MAAITAFYDSDGRERIARALAPAFERALGSAAVLDAIDHAIECALTSLRPAADAQTPTPYYSGGELYAFTLQAARRHLIDQQRRPGLRPTAGASDQMPAVSETLADSHAATPEERWIETELAHQVREAAAGLDELTLEVLWLRHVEGLKKPQIEARLGLTAKRLRLLLHAGNEKLCALFRGVEAGTTCGGRREGVLRLAFDLAGGQEARRARAHVGHCRECALRFARAQAYRRAVAGLVPFPLIGHAAAGSAVGLLDQLRLFVARLFGQGGEDATRAIVATRGGASAGVAGSAKLLGICAAGVAVTAGGLYCVVHGPPGHHHKSRPAAHVAQRTARAASTSAPGAAVSPASEHAAIVRAVAESNVLRERRAAKRRAEQRAAARRAARKASPPDEFFSPYASPGSTATTSSPTTTTSSTASPPTTTTTSSSDQPSEFPLP